MDLAPTPVGRRAPWREPSRGPARDRHGAGICPAADGENAHNMYYGNFCAGTRGGDQRRTCTCLFANSFLRRPARDTPGRQARRRAQDPVSRLRRTGCMVSALSFGSSPPGVLNFGVRCFGGRACDPLRLVLSFRCGQAAACGPAATSSSVMDVSQDQPSNAGSTWAGVSVATRL